MWKHSICIIIDKPFCVFHTSTFYKLFTIQKLNALPPPPHPLSYQIRRLLWIFRTSPRKKITPDMKRHLIVTARWLCWRHLQLWPPKVAFIFLKASWNFLEPCEEDRWKLLAFSEARVWRFSLLHSCIRCLSLSFTSSLVWKA